MDSRREIILQVIDNIPFFLKVENTNKLWLILILLYQVFIEQFVKNTNGSFIKDIIFLIKIIPIFIHEIATTLMHKNA